MAFFFCKIFVIFIHIVLFTSCRAQDDSLLVKAPCGSLQGRLEPVVNGLSVRQFLGIPYAKPPTGQLRFARPQPAEQWTGVRDAAKFGPECPQVTMFQMAEKMAKVNSAKGGSDDAKDAAAPQSEDCLSLNVYIPIHSAQHNAFAVMVWIHGGGFHLGSGSSFDPSVLVALNDVIVVTINYRLGVLGFFNIPGTDVKGNYGMHDQILALKWVQQNIAAFGGDPDQVTLFGESAGGVSVSNHILSPLSKGLFRHAIAQSGSSTSPMNALKVTSTKPLELFSEVLKCDVKSEKAELMECLRSKTMKEILAAQSNVSFPMLSKDYFLMYPILDGEFLPDKPATLLKQDKVNQIKMMIGMTSNEGGISYLFAPQMYEDGLAMEGVKAVLKESIFPVIAYSQILENAIVFEYIDHSDPNNSSKLRQASLDINSDFHFNAPIVMEAKYLAQTNDVYFYVFDHTPHLSTYPPWVGAYHGIDISYVFGMPFKMDGFGEDIRWLSPSKFSDLEAGFSRYIMRLWTSFAKHGDPNVGITAPLIWPRYNTTDHVHFRLAMEPKLEHSLRKRKVAFWNDFVPKFTGKNKVIGDVPYKRRKDEL